MGVGQKEIRTKLNPENLKTACKEISALSPQGIICSICGDNVKDVKCERPSTTCCVMILSNVCETHFHDRAKSSV